MRGEANSQAALFSYIDLESPIPTQHPIRKVRQVVDKALDDMDWAFEDMYARVGRPSIPPEQLIRALLLQILFTIRSERQLMERLDYDLMFRWFVGLGTPASPAKPHRPPVPLAAGALTGLSFYRFAKS